MAKISVVLLSDSETHGHLGRLVNALELTKEAQEADDDVELLFDGAATTWIPKLADPDHDLHRVFEAIRESISGACEFCANAFEVRDAVKEAGIDFLSEYEGHPSLRKRIADGYQIVTF